MIVEYAKRAIADVSEIADYYRTVADERVALRFEARLKSVVDRVARRPESARPVLGREGVRIVPLLSFPYMLFYRVLTADRIRILHIRHASRSEWTR